MPRHSPSETCTTRWWHVRPGSEALSIQDAASVSGTQADTSRCRGSFARCSCASSQPWMAASRGQPSMEARSTSFSVSRLRFWPSPLKTTMTEVAPVLVSSCATSANVAPSSHRRSWCHGCPTRLPTGGPAQSGTERNSGARAWVKRTRSSDESTPTAIMLFGRTTMRWLMSRLVMRAAASTGRASLGMMRELTLNGSRHSHSAMHTLLGTPSSKARTASRGVTMP
mmetsp:Transcript_43423/g.138186  ORF Transcript_43423/g.138186 Transcript_43423/m.138186 type:complete len:226 (+) Transcript_43423:1048-1725(+)